MVLRLGHRRERAHPFHDFDHALFAFALLAAGGGHVDAQGFGVIEQRQARLSPRVDLSVDGEGDGHFVEYSYQPFASSSAFTASATSLRGALALFFLAPLPLSQIVVGSLQSAFGGENIDLLP